MKLSILIPVYNERTVVERCLSLVLTAPLPEEMERELVIVDDCSTDGTFPILQRLAVAFPQIRLYQHPVNRGKGAAVRTAIEKATGDFSLIQDADLEYDPAEYPRLLRPLLDGHADAVFGSRYLAGDQSRVLPFWHSMINKGLTLVSNMFCNLNLTDMETCYKVFRTDLLKSIPIRSDRFGFEPEITMKSAKRKFRIYEVPISYHGRTYEEGKKIGWKDGIKAFAVIFQILAHRRSLRGLVWAWRTEQPHRHAAILELARAQTPAPRRRQSAGDRCWYRQSYGPADVAPHALRSRREGSASPACFAQPLPAYAERRCTAYRSRRSPPDLAGLENVFDTVLCLNVLESLDDPAAVLNLLCTAVRPGGSVVVLVPNVPGAFGSLDRKMGHQRRYSPASHSLRCWPAQGLRRGNRGEL